MDTYTCSVKLNITNGFGDPVLNAINDANVPLMISTELGKDGIVESSTHKWDSGVFSHDLYLTYKFNINSYRLVKSKGGKCGAKTLKYSGFLRSTIRSNLQSSITDGFNKQLSGPLKGLAVVLSSCSVV
tara:strand:+ start:204 stop:590 length:387 start_codon:yes stop_codon:yes gene_type:complete